jgi:hypothetical protein
MASRSSCEASTISKHLVATGKGYPQIPCHREIAESERRIRRDIWGKREQFPSVSPHGIGRPHGGLFFLLLGLAGLIRSESRSRVVSWRPDPEALDFERLYFSFDREMSWAAAREGSLAHAAHGA